MSDLADLHRAAFGVDGAHGWSPAALRAALDDPSLIVVVHADAYAIARPILDEAELLLIGTRAQARRNGAATAALAALETSLQARGVAKIILEVAARNAPARAFYARHGFR
ncbi:MAG: GNAT family N-acetyltransferase, partial [Planctomycetota bacterium]